MIAFEWSIAVAILAFAAGYFVGGAIQANKTRKMLKDLQNKFLSSESISEVRKKI